MDLTDAVEKDEHEDHDKQQTGRTNASDADVDAQRQRSLCHHGKQRIQHPFDADAQPDAADQSQPCAQHRLTGDHIHDVTLFHAQDVKYAKLFFPPLHQEAVGIKQKDDDKQRDDIGPKSQQRLHLHTAKHVHQIRIGGQRADDVIHRYAQDAGQQIRYEHPCILAQIGKGQPQEKPTIHDVHHLRPAASARWRCAHTSHRCRQIRGKAGHRPSRP